MTAFHLGMTIAYARWFIKNKSWKKYPLLTGATSRQDALNYLDELERRGFEYVPCCDNINDKGICLGIPEPKI